MARRLVERVQAAQLNVDDVVECGSRQYRLPDGELVRGAGDWTATIANVVHYKRKTKLKYENATGGNDGYHAPFSVPNTTVFKRVRKQPLEREHARSWMSR